LYFEIEFKNSDHYSTGYGMTEITGMSHMTPSVDIKHGSVGVLLPNLECKVQW